MKTKRFLQILKKGEYTVVIERLKCNNYGNPRYNVTIFDSNNIFRGNWNVTTYVVSTTIDNIIKEEIEK